MTPVRELRRILAATTCGAVMALTIAPAASSAPTGDLDRASAKAPDEFEHTVTNTAAQGRFRCGDLVLTVVAGREIETQDGFLQAGVAHVFINRVWRRAKLSGSDGETYRASGVVSAWFVLKAPNFNRPVRGNETIVVVFRSGANKSPGYLKERIVIRDSKEKELLSGPCDYADE
jgi:hypothetical protein